MNDANDGTTEPDGFVAIDDDGAAIAAGGWRESTARRADAIAVGTYRVLPATADAMRAHRDGDAIDVRRGPDGREWAVAGFDPADEWDRLQEDG